MQSDWDTEMSDDDGQRSMGDAETAYLDENGNRTAMTDLLSTIFSLQTGGGPHSSESHGSRTIHLSGISVQDLSRLLGARIAAAGYHDDDDQDDDDDDDEDIYDSHHTTLNWFEPVTEPQKVGVDLLGSGDFGRVTDRLRTRRKSVNVAKTLLNRATKHRMPLCYPKEEIANNLIPNSYGTAVAAYDANIYTGQFSADSSFYYTCSQDFNLHVYDTTTPPVPIHRHATSRRSVLADSGLQTSMKVIKTIQGHPGRWTITDANLSPDNERMIYSSITPTVYMTSTLDGSQAQIPIPFADPPSRQTSVWGYGESFGIWSCRFSADGNEVIAGGSDNIFGKWIRQEIYDLLAHRRTVKISAHTDDVNSCCWADTSSGNVLVSASDDTFIKVWDRRSLGASPKPSGVLIGHTEGITYVSAKGDGRYVVSNGKDQALRLWDLRKMRTSHEFERVEHKRYGVSNFDYRYPHYPKPRYEAHPLDCSVMTYRGHAVLRTLIRCHFSPMETTGAQYIYSGSADGRIHIWSLDGRVVQVLDRSRTLPMSFDPSGPDPEAPQGLRSSVCVRDLSWHSQEPVILSAGWESGRGGSMVARHEWKGLSKRAGALEDWIEKHAQESKELPKLRRSARLARRQRIPGSYQSESEED